MTRFVYTPLPMAALKLDPQVAADRKTLAVQWRRMRNENRKATNLIFRRTKAAHCRGPPRKE